MLIQNCSPNTIFYGISNPGSADCGTIDANQTQDAGYNNQSNVSVVISPLGGSSSFPITIPETGTGKVITVGLYFG
ncbi:MAG: hypothetical protein U0941_23230 [Planctomycetaceae bacterium]